MTARVAKGRLFVGSQRGPSKEWMLPPPSDKLRLRRVRTQALEFAKKHGATVGQENAVKKALTEAGYYLIK
jgi:hypothetical protein